MTDLFLPPLHARFSAYRALAEAALAQVDDDAWNRALPGETSAEGENTLAVIVRHVGGNLTSRFTDFLTTDGEKPDRHRDREFEPVMPNDARAAWQQGWTALLTTLDALTDADLSRTVTIRQQPHTVFDALLRSLAHVSSHVGQIVLLAKHHAGPGWTPLTIPRGQSETYQAQPFVGSAFRG